MSMHTTVQDLFQNHISKDYQGKVQLGNADINRIVTTVVQNYTPEVEVKDLMTKTIRSYVDRYKAPKRGGCGCGK